MSDLVFVAATFAGAVLGFVVLVGGLAVYMNYTDRKDQRK